MIILAKYIWKHFIMEALEFFGDYQKCWKKCLFIFIKRLVLLIDWIYYSILGIILNQWHIKHEHKFLESCITLEVKIGMDWKVLSYNKALRTQNYDKKV